MSESGQEGHPARRYRMPLMTTTPPAFGCASAVRRTFTVNRLRLSALEWPAPGRPALCFLHGGSAHAHWFDAVVPPFIGRYPLLSLDHLGREGIAEREGRFLYRFDPLTSGERQPVDVWPLLERITAPTLVVRGEHSPILPVPMAQDILKRVPRVRLVEIAGAYHHLVLDAPGPFTRALDEFLGSVTF